MKEFNEKNLFSNEIQEKKTDIFLVPPEDADLRNGFEELSNLIKKHDIAEILSEKIGLDWKIKSIRVEHLKGNAEWRGMDTALIDYSIGIWGVSSLAHEMLHLILRQNDWMKDEKIKKFVEMHKELNNEKRGDGYLIEQMVAYLLQRDILREIGKKEGIKNFFLGWDEDHFEKILKSEYYSDWLREFGEKMIKEWSTDKKDLMQWIRNVCSEN